MANFHELNEPVAWALMTNGKPNAPRIRTLSCQEPSEESLQIAAIEGETWAPLFATPHTEAVRMSEAEIEALAGDYSDDRTDVNPSMIQFARAVEQATAARLGVKMGDARHADQA